MHGANRQAFGFVVEKRGPVNPKSVATEVLAIIPARGGSKGIPRKNVRLLNGKPLIAYSIEQALRTPAIKRVVVSTDDAEIGAVAQQYGAEVVWRPAEISGDTASSESALLHVLDYLAQTEGYKPELVVFLQATSPLRQPDDIQNAIATLQREQADSLFSACRYEGHIWYVKDGELIPAHDYRNRRRRQDKPEELSENGSIYVFKPWVLREFNNRLGGKIAVYRMHVLDSYQVDELADLEMIAQIMQIRSSSISSLDLAGLAQVRLLVLDFDGVMTDNRVLVSEDGKEAVWCDRSDGWGIACLKDAGVGVIVLSTETNPVVEARCRKLGIECFSGQVNKLATLQRLVLQRRLVRDQVAYVGNDVNDLECMQWVGWPIAVADATPEIRAVSRLVTAKPGGRGAVREVAAQLLAAKSP